MNNKLPIIILAAVLLLLASFSQAQFIDYDGHLLITWSEPQSGNPLDYYYWSYTINGIVDSITGTSSADDTLDNSVSLANSGDWAIFNIKAVSIFNDTSTSVSSDTACYMALGNIGGVVTNFSGMLLEGVQITVSEMPVDDYTDAQGEYLLDSLFVSIYSVLFSHPSYHDMLISEIEVLPESTTIINVMLYRSDDSLYVPGDINGDKSVLLSDITYGVNYFLHVGQPPPDSFWNDSTGAYLYSAADANGSCEFISSDLTYLLTFFRGNNPPPKYCPQTPPFSSQLQPQVRRQKAPASDSKLSDKPTWVR